MMMNTDITTESLGIEVGDVVRFSPLEDTPGHRLMDSIGDGPMLVIRVSNSLITVDQIPGYCGHFKKGKIWPYTFLAFRFDKDEFLTQVYRSGDLWKKKN